MIKIGLTECFSKSYLNTLSLDNIPPKTIDTIIFENRQGINLMSLSAPWADYKNK